MKGRDCHGVSGYGVAIGCTRLRTRLRLGAPGLTGPGLARLALEAIADPIARYEQGGFIASRNDQSRGEWCAN